MTLEFPSVILRIRRDVGQAFFFFFHSLESSWGTTILASTFSRCNFSFAMDQLKQLEGLLEITKEDKSDDRVSLYKNNPPTACNTLTNLSQNTK